MHEGPPGVYAYIVRPCPKCFTDIDSFNPQNNLYYPHFLDEKMGTERLRNLPEATQLAGGQGKIEAQAV